MSSYWPWWASALALATIAVTYFLVLGRTMGVSGSVGRVLRYREERRGEEAERALGSEEDLEAALAAATREEFGDGGCGAIADDEGQESGAAAGSPSRAMLPARTPISGEAAFLIMIVVGGFLAAIARGAFALRFDLGEDFARLVGRGAPAIAALFAGGILVGFGTRFSGGCTSGHGLAGCARLERGSLVATACFFGAAVVVSFAIGGAR